MTTLQLVIKLQAMLVDSFQSLASGVSAELINDLNNVSRSVIEWLVNGYQHGSFTLLEVASRAAHFDVLIDSLAPFYVAGKITLLQIATWAANFMAAYS